MKIGYVVGYIGSDDKLPDFSHEAFDGRLDAERHAANQNDRYASLKHRVYELHSVEEAVNAE